METNGLDVQREAWRRSAKYNIGDNLMELKKLLDIALENARIAYGRRS